MVEIRLAARREEAARERAIAPTEPIAPSAPASPIRWIQVQILGR
jgi:hypothetical protein